MPHRPVESCPRRHPYRTREHLNGCDADSWPHYHATCRRCGFDWWQPSLFGADVLRLLKA